MDTRTASVEKAPTQRTDGPLYRLGKNHPFISGLIDGITMPARVNNLFEKKQTPFIKAIDKITGGTHDAIHEAKLLGFLVEGRTVYGWATGAILAMPLTVSTLLGNGLREVPALLKEIPGSIRETFSK